MKIYKFGGASVKDAEGVKNLVTILNHLGQQQTLIVVSAMGKTTDELITLANKSSKSPNPTYGKISGDLVQSMNFQTCAVKSLRFDGIRKKNLFEKKLQSINLQP